jgi:YebC/PmpR family DNA-binding regulatory protein
MRPITVERLKMSGHSKWNNIKNRKGAQDQLKSKVFSQLSRLIRAATKQGGSGDPKSNSSLRLILEKARVANMPKDKVQKAIDVGLGKGEAAHIQEIHYEGFGPGGVGIMIVALTNNVNRSSAEIRFILGKFGGSLGSPGSARYMFTRNEEGEFVATMKFPVSEEDTSKLAELMDSLREFEDVEDVFAACDFPEDIEN